MLLEAGHSQLQFLRWARQAACSWLKEAAMAAHLQLWELQSPLVCTDRRRGKPRLYRCPSPALLVSPVETFVRTTKPPRLPALSLVLAQQETAPVSSSATPWPRRKAEPVAPPSALLPQLQAPCWEAQRQPRQ